MTREELLYACRLLYAYASVGGWCSEDKVTVMAGLGALERLIINDTKLDGTGGEDREQRAP